MEQKECIVIGSGVAGLANAALLASKGHSVTVYEQSATYGGKIGQIDLDGSLFDTGPSVCTDPDVIDAVYKRCKVNPRDYWQYEKLTETIRYFWPDDNFEYIMPMGRTQIERSLVHTFKERPKKIRKYFAKTEDSYRKVARHYLDRPISFTSLLSPKIAIRAVKLVPLLVQSLHVRNSRYFLNKKTVQLFDRFASYSGSDPYRTPAISGYAGIVELCDGVYFPKGGMRAIADGLYQLCVDKGVKFVFNQRVSGIVVSDGVATHVRTSKQTNSCDIVVYDGDAVRLHELLGDATIHKSLSSERSTSAIVFYWKVRGNYKKLGLHNILFSQDYAREYSDLQRGELPDDPTIYINITCKKDKTLSERGTENWFVMINVPAGTKDVAVLRAKEIVKDKIEKYLGGYVTVLEEDYLSPSKLDAATGAWQGAIYGQANNSLQSVLRRPKNKVNGIDNVYRIGGTAHPGGGIPLAVRSAIITSELL
jgi:phytoene desaturase